MKHNQGLAAFSLKLTKKDHYSLKLLSAMDRNFRYQYELLDAAVEWAFENKHGLFATASQKEGDTRSNYLSSSTGLLTSTLH